MSTTPPIQKADEKDSNPSRHTKNPFEITNPLFELLKPGWWKDPGETDEIDVEIGISCGWGLGD